MKKQFIILSAAAVGCAAMLGTVFFSASTHLSLAPDASNQSHTLTLTQYGQVVSGATSDAGNPIYFSHNGLSSYSGVGKLYSGGYIQNYTKISGIGKVEVTLSSGSVRIYFSKTDTVNWIGAIDDTTYDLSDIRPNYFKVEATSDAVISSIKVIYDCYDHQTEADGYALYLNGEEAPVSFFDATTPGEGYDKQLRATLDVYPGDVISFKKDSSFVNVTASGDGNNAYGLDGKSDYLMVRSESKQADLYFKINGSSHDVWLTGNGGTSPRSEVAKGPMLQAWNWNINTIMEQLDTIAASGYRSIQISPMQVHNSASGDWRGHWWELYQPQSFSIATEYGESPIGNKSQLTALCAAAKEKGVYIVMDVVLNHICGTSKTSDYGVWQYEKEIVENQLYWTPEDDCYGVEKILHVCPSGDFSYPDLRTSDKRVQRRALSLLNEYLDCGVTGFRFDAAKHIETPFDGYYASDFWGYVVNGSRRYAAMKGYEKPYYYGEIIGGDEGGRQVGWYKPYMAITENSASYNIRNAIGGKTTDGLSGDYYAGAKQGFQAGDYVLWAESHDNFQTINDDSTSWMSEEQANKVYAIQASRSYAVPMYMARPGADTSMGSMGLTWWQDATIAAVNKLHNDYDGQGEKIDISSTSGTFVNVRGFGSDAGALIVKVDGSGDVNVYLPNMADGVYKDLVSGKTYTVSNGRATIDCYYGISVLEPSNATHCYLVGNQTFTGKTASWTIASGLKMEKTADNIAQIENIRIEEGAEVQVVKASDQDIGDSSKWNWYKVTDESLASTQTYAHAAGNNLVFTKGGTYSIYLNNEAKYYVFGTPDQEEVGEIEVTVNGAVVPVTDDVPAGSTDKHVFTLDLKAGDVISMKEGTTTFVFGGKDGTPFASQTATSYTFAAAGNYTFYVNSSGQIWIVTNSGGETPTPEDQVTVTFSITKDAGMGNRVYIIGDFCGWDIGNAVAMDWNDGNVWKATVTKDKGTAWTFKFVVAAYNNPTGVSTWESGSDRTFTFNTSGTQTFSWR